MAVCLSKVTYQVDGNESLFTVPFPYIAPTHVTVTNVPTDGVGVPVTFTWVTTSSIRLDAAPSVGALVIQRLTEREIALAEYDGDTLVPDDLNLQNKQMLYISQEDRETGGFISTIGLPGADGAPATLVPYNGTVTAYYPAGYLLLTAGGAEYLIPYYNVET